METHFSSLKFLVQHCITTHTQYCMNITRRLYSSLYYITTYITFSATWQNSKFARIYGTLTTRVAQYMQYEACAGKEDQFISLCPSLHQFDEDVGSQEGVTCRMSRIILLLGQSRSTNMVAPRPVLSQTNRGHVNKKVIVVKNDLKGYDDKVEQCTVSVETLSPWQPAISNLQCAGVRL